MSEREREREGGGGGEAKFGLSRSAGRGGIHDIVTNFETARQLSLPPLSMLADECEIAKTRSNRIPPLNYTSAN